MIKRNTLIQLSIEKGRSDQLLVFRVLSLYDKFYNKWNPSRLQSKEWSKNFPKGKFRVEARMVQFGHMNNKFSDIDPGNSSWSARQVFVTVDASLIKGVLFDVQST